MPVHMQKAHQSGLKKNENVFQIRALLQPIFPPGCTETSYQF